MLKHIQNTSTMTYSSEQELKQLISELNSIKQRYKSHLQLAGELVVAMEQSVKATANQQVQAIAL
jgi:hypothetical protein